MKNKINKFDNIFNCPKCNKTLWHPQRLKDGTKVCQKCYEKYMHVEIEKTAVDKVYYESMAKTLVDKGLSELIFNFFEKKYNFNPSEEELTKLWKLITNKYDVEIEYDSFFNIIKSIYESHRENKDLEYFEKDLIPTPPPSPPPEEKPNYICEICKSRIDKETYDFSVKVFDKSLCINHQGTKHPRNLFVALKKRGVPCEFEVYDGYKYVDIAIHDIKLYIEVGETLITSNPKQFLDDLKNDRFSKEGVYQTRRISNESIDNYLEEIADTLKEVYNKTVNG